MMPTHCQTWKKTIILHNQGLSQNRFTPKEHVNLKKIVLICQKKTKTKKNIKIAKIINNLTKYPQQHFLKFVMNSF